MTKKPRVGFCDFLTFRSAVLEKLISDKMKVSQVVT